MKTLTVRLDMRLARALAAAARDTGRPVSDIVRDALDAALTPETIGERSGHVRGRLQLAKRPTGWRAALRARNVRP